MRKILICFVALAAMMMFYACKQAGDGICRIQGEVIGEQYEGKRIFLVPFKGPKTEIKDGKFHFETDTTQMYTILLDYHYRFGVQPLLVIGEPGELKVVIDSISHAKGTPQNDSLEKWKERTEIHNRELGKMRRHIIDLRKRGDTIQAKYIQQRADSFHLVYKNYSRRLADNMKEGVFHDFLKEQFPLTYKRKFPDGRIATMNADTNEEIPE